jgi:hypothetical protein
MTLARIVSDIGWPASIAAVGILASLFGTWWTHQKRSTFDMIDGIYALCHRLHDQLHRDWCLSHLFCIGEDVYKDVRTRIAEATQAIGKDQDRLIVRERLFAIQVFIAYEQAYYQWKKSGVIPTPRKRFMKEMLDYFTDRILRNPRLRAYLESDRSGSTLHLEESSAKFLWRQMDRQPAVRPDEGGPFNYVVPKVPQSGIG